MSVIYGAWTPCRVSSVYACETGHDVIDHCWEQLVTKLKGWMDAFHRFVNCKGVERGRQFPVSLTTIISHWRQLKDGNCSFRVRHFLAQNSTISVVYLSGSSNEKSTSTSWKNPEKQQYCVVKPLINAIFEGRGLTCERLRLSYANSFTKGQWARTFSIVGSAGEDSKILYNIIIFYRKRLRGPLTTQ